ncbi:MAG: archaeosortase/exosortase family protein [Thermococcus sp.]|uniref:archaeosortase/exosortase family protein n=1 Tax=Thermococcus sp. TaxID=35749 RepID=UPI001D364D2D|nr:archaeosortase/exosortase family protein [Thermococcus sp.]MBO8174752.1 archaeosortase/exosortase family protein [Thermococcus sp.]
MRHYEELALKFMSLLALTFGMYVVFKPIESLLILPIARISTMALQLIGYSVYSSKSVIIVEGIAKIEIIGACTPVLPFLLLVSYVAIFGKKSKYNAIFLLFGFIFLFIVDVARIMLMVVLTFYGFELEKSHQLSSYLLIPASYLFILWIYNKFFVSK